MSLLSLLGGGLARLLIRGFERALARSIPRSMTASALTARILSVERSLSAAEAAALADFVKAGQRVASLLERKISSMALTVEDFPQNPYALGDQPGGNRFITDGVVEIYGPDGTPLQTLDVSVRNLDIPNNELLAQIMADKAKEIFMKYLPNGMQYEKEELQAKLATVYFSERAF